MLILCFPCSVLPFHKTEQTKTRKNSDNRLTVLNVCAKTSVIDFAHIFLQ